MVIFLAKFFTEELEMNKELTLDNFSHIKGKISYHL